MHRKSAKSTRCFLYADEVPPHWVSGGKNLRIWSANLGLSWFDGGGTHRLMNIVDGSRISFSGVGFRDGYIKADTGVSGTGEGGCIRVMNSNVDITDAECKNCGTQGPRARGEISRTSTNLSNETHETKQKSV